MGCRPGRKRVKGYRESHQACSPAINNGGTGCGSTRMSVGRVNPNKAISHSFPVHSSRIELHSFDGVRMGANSLSRLGHYLHHSSHSSSGWRACF